MFRHGRRAGRPTMTLHVLLRDEPVPPRAGLVVSKAVGGSVVRHRVARRLRHLLRERLERLAPGTLLIVRAAPAAASASSSALAGDLDTALDRFRS